MNMQTFLNDYFSAFDAAFKKTDASVFQGAIDALDALRARGGRLFVAGNGGSAATAEHFLCDFAKNAVAGDVNRFKVISLSSSLSRITALGNDISFDSTFSEQLKNLMEPNDMLLVITASGTSPNIVNAVKFAKAMGNQVISMTGFTGGPSRESADFSLHTSLKTYEQIEDYHLMLCHLLVYWYKTGANR